MNNLNSKNEEETCKADEKIFIDLCWLNLDNFPTSSYIIYKNIQHIYLEGNKVKKLNDEFFPAFPKLKWLDIRNNELEEIPKTVANHPSLQVLLLEGNKLEELPLELGSIPTLRGLQLARNPLVFPPKYVLEKGSADVIDFLQSEWQNKEKKLNVDASLQSCQIKSAKKKLPESGPLQKKKRQHSLRRKCGKTISQPTLSKKPTSHLKDCVRVTKLVRPKPRTAVTILKDWSSMVNDSGQLPSVEEVEQSKLNPTTKTASLPAIVTDSTKSFYNKKQQQEDSGLLVKSKLLKDTWLRKIRDVLAEQESELQRMRDREFLSKWQNDAKDQQTKMWAEYVQGDAPKLEVPFGTDDEYKKMPSRGDLNKNEKSSQFKRLAAKGTAFSGEMMASKINSILDVLQQLRKERSSRCMSPRSEQENFSNEIKKITELQRTLSSLKAINFRQSIRL